MSDSTITVVDGLGREVTVPWNPEFVICSGPGCLRLLTYLQAQSRATAVDDIEVRQAAYDARPYAMANQEFRDLPVFGEFRGNDNPELIAALDPQPLVIFKTFYSMGTDPLELEAVTGIPVVVLNYGDMLDDRENLNNSLRIMGAVMNREQRAEDLISFFDSTIADLGCRTGSIAEEDKTTCYVGGIAMRGPQGFQSTEPSYPPFVFVKAANVASPRGSESASAEHADTAKEQIAVWNPEVIFIDASSMQNDQEAGALYQLQNDPAYSTLSAVENGEIYGLLPYNLYTVNFGSMLADAYFIGKILYPARFEDIDPAQKADDIYRFLLGNAVFPRLKNMFGEMVFERIVL